MGKLADTRLNDAVDLVARGILAGAARNVRWEDHPDIGEHDWTRICDLMDTVAGGPDLSDDGYQAAYTYLIDRAGGVRP